MSDIAKRQRGRMFPDAVDGERVIAVDGSTVVTRRERVTTTYLGVRDAISVGDVLARPPRHTSRRVHHEWSPFDADGDVDDDNAQAHKARRVF